MASEVLLEKDGIIKRAYIGFSWTTFFSPLLVTLFRDQWLHTIIIIFFIVLFTNTTLLLIKDMAITQIVLIFFFLSKCYLHLIFSFSYNKIHYLGLIKEGYHPINVNSNLSISIPQSTIPFWKLLLFPCTVLLLRGVFYQALFSYIFVYYIPIYIIILSEYFIEYQYNSIIILSIYGLARIVFASLYYIISSQKS